MRALTVRQPWAWAIIHGGKDVENRSRNVAGAYRGPIAIHAGASFRTADMLAVFDVCKSMVLAAPTSAIVGVVDVVGAHVGTGCQCSKWAMDVPVHYELANPRPCAPIPCKGRLGLWTVPAEVEAQIMEAMS